MPVIISSEFKLKEAVKRYIDTHYDKKSTFTSNTLPVPLGIGGYSAMPSLSFILNLKDETFSEKLMQLIKQKGTKAHEVYKAADMTRQHFYKIKTESKPAKETALALAIALKLTLDETNELLHCAGYTLSHSLESDLIVEYFIKKRMYNIDTINEQLINFGYKPLTNRQK